MFFSHSLFLRLGGVCVYAYVFGYVWDYVIMLLFYLTNILQKDFILLLSLNIFNSSITIQILLF